MANCANCGHKGIMSGPKAKESWWQKFHPVKAVFCRRCFKEAASAGHTRVRSGDAP